MDYRHRHSLTLNQKKELCKFFAVDELIASLRSAIRSGGVGRRGGGRNAHVALAFKKIRVINKKRPLCGWVFF
jgi:hypothetical protein